MRVSQTRMNVAGDCNDRRAQEWPARHPKALDAQTFWNRLLTVLSRHCPPALLYRARRGENPYDFSRPEVQRSYLNFQLNRWS